MQACLAQSAELKALNLVVVGSSPTVGALAKRSKLRKRRARLGAIKLASTAAFGAGLASNYYWYSSAWCLVWFEPSFAFPFCFVRTNFCLSLGGHAFLPPMGDRVATVATGIGRC